MQLENEFIMLTVENGSKYKLSPIINAYYLTENIVIANNVSFISKIMTNWSFNNIYVEFMQELNIYKI